MKNFKFLRDNQKDRFTELLNYARQIDWGNSIYERPEPVVNVCNYLIRYSPDTRISMNEMIEQAKRVLLNECGNPRNPRWNVDIRPDVDIRPYVDMDVVTIKIELRYF